MFIPLNTRFLFWKNSLLLFFHLWYNDPNSLHTVHSTTTLYNFDIIHVDFLSLLACPSVFVIFVESFYYKIHLPYLLLSTCWTFLFCPILSYAIVHSINPIPFILLVKSRHLFLPHHLPSAMYLLLYHPFISGIYLLHLSLSSLLIIFSSISSFPLCYLSVPSYPFLSAIYLFHLILSSLQTIFSSFLSSLLC
jgi:hypothetical protein